MRPTRLLDPDLLPGRVVMPSFMAWCVACEESTHHAGLCGERGEELGACCLWCGQKFTADARRECLTCDGEGRR